MGEKRNGFVDLVLTLSGSANISFDWVGRGALHVAYWFPSTNGTPTWTLHAEKTSMI